MKTKLSLVAILAVATLDAVFAQGPLTPPGAPAPTMKTLDQIEPRKEVNATNTPGDSLHQFVINTAGSYFLGGNITGVSGKSGILVNVEGTTLDLNGFKLIGVNGAFEGIKFSSTHRNTVIRNGTIQNWPGFGILGDFAIFGVFEDLRVYRNGGGIIAPGGSMMRRCVVSYNTSNGIATGGVSAGGEISDSVVVVDCVANGNGGTGFSLSRTTAMNCISRGNGAAGFHLSDDSTLSNCLALDNTGVGISAGPSVSLTLTNCMASDNTGDGINSGAGSTLTNCTAKDNRGTFGIFAGEGSTLNGCTAFSNDVEHGIHADLRSTVTNCTASGNDSTASDSWGISVGVQCTVNGCTASGNTNTNGTPTGSTGGGIQAGGSSNVQHCTVVGNRGDGILINGDARVVGNNCDSNGFGGDGAGIHSLGADNRIEGNNVTDNTRGIDVDSSGTLIIKNSASGNGSNYEIAANNVYGPIVDRTVPASLAVSGNSAVSVAGSTDPWTNFAF